MSDLHHETELDRHRRYHTDEVDRPRPGLVIGPYLCGWLLITIMATLIHVGMLPILAIGGAVGLMFTVTVTLANAPSRSVGPRRGVDVDLRFSVSLRSAAAPEARRAVGPPLRGAEWANTPHHHFATPASDNTLPSSHDSARPLGKSRANLPALTEGTNR